MNCFLCNAKENISQLRTELYDQYDNFLWSINVDHCNNHTRQDCINFAKEEYEHNMTPPKLQHAKLKVTQ